MEVERSSSRSPYPASARRAPALMSRSRDGQWAWAGVLGLSGANVQHPAAISRGRRTTSVTGFTIHDNVILFMIPAADFLQ
jgi:hypothetical protein